MFEDYKNTLWKSKLPKYRFSIFAVVRQAGTNLIAWELEMREGSVYHPAYGIVPKEYVSDFDVFTPEAGGKVPEFIINSQDPQFYCVGPNVKQILGDYSNSVLF